MKISNNLHEIQNKSGGKYFIHFSTIHIGLKILKHIYTQKNINFEEKLLFLQLSNTVYSCKVSTYILFNKTKNKDRDSKSDNLYILLFGYKS